MHFKVLVARADGIKVRLRIEAESPDAARVEASKVGRPISVRPSVRLIRQPMSRRDRNVFLVRMSAMLESRVGVSEALRVMASTFGGEIRRVSLRLLGYVMTGDDLVRAIKRIGSPDFPRSTIAMLESGADTMGTAKALAEAASFEAELADATRSAGKGILGGAVGFGFASVVTIGSTWMLGPMVTSSPFIKDSGAVDIGVYTLAGTITGWIMAALVAIAAVIGLLCTVGKWVHPVWADKLIARIPVCGDIALAKDSFVACWSMSLLIRSGVRFEESLRIAGHSAPRGLLRHDLGMAQSAIHEGRSWAGEVSAFHPTDRACLDCAENREQVAATLGNLAKQYRSLYTDRISAFSLGLNITAVACLVISAAVLFGEGVVPFFIAINNILAQ